MTLTHFCRIKLMQIPLWNSNPITHLVFLSCYNFFHTFKTCIYVIAGVLGRPFFSFYFFLIWLCLFLLHSSLHLGIHSICYVYFQYIYMLTLERRFYSISLSLSPFKENFKWLINKSVLSLISADNLSLAGHLYKLQSLSCVKKKN